MKSISTLATYGALVATTLIATPAFAAEFGMSLAAVGNIADAKVETDGDNQIDAEDKLGWGVSLMGNMQLNELVSVESGLIFVNRRFRYGGDDFNFTQSQNILQIPVLARVWIGSVLSAGIGPFVQFPLGSSNNDFELGDADIAGFEVDRDMAEAGLTGAVTLNIAVNESTGVFVEGRYNYGLFRLSDGDGDYNNTQDLAAHAGVRLQF